MAKKKPGKVDIEKLPPLGHNPFSVLGKRLGLEPSITLDHESPGPNKPKEPLPSPAPTLLVRKEKRKKGKVVTCIYHLAEGAPDLARRLRQQLGTGGNLENGTISLQGDHCEKVITYLREQGYQVRGQ